MITDRFRVLEEECHHLRATQILLQNEIKGLQDRLKISEEQKEEAVLDLEAILEQFNRLKQKVNDFDQLSLKQEQDKELLESALAAEKLFLSNKEKEWNKKLVELEAKYKTNLEELKNAFQKQLEDLKQQSIDKEQRAKMIQQLLAKKMKENTALNVKVEEQAETIFTLESQYAQVKAKLSELQHTTNTQESLLVKTQARCDEKVQLAELQAAKWEEKFFQMQEKWQSSNLHNNELKKYEERYQKVQGLLASLATFVDPEAHVQHLFVKETVPKESSQIIALPIKEEVLFEHRPTKLKQNLFE